MGFFSTDNTITLDYLKSHGFEWDTDPIIVSFDGEHTRLVKRYSDYWNSEYLCMSVYFQWEDIGDPDSPKNSMYIAYKTSTGCWTHEVYYNILCESDFNVCMNRVGVIFNNISKWKLKKNLKMGL